MVFNQAHHVVEDCTGADTFAELLGQVGGRVVPMLSPGLPPMDQHPGVNQSLALGLDAFPVDFINGYLQLSERMHQQVFPPSSGSLTWMAGK